MKEDQIIEIVQLKEIEEKLSISLNNVSYKIEENEYIKVFAELINPKSLKLKKDITVDCAVCTESGQIIDVDHCTICKSDFLGVQILSFQLYTNTSKIKKIKLYPGLF